MRIRTICGAIAELKRRDADTALTESALRRMVRSGAIPSRRTGTRFLLDVDALLAYLGGKNAGDEHEAP